MTDDLPEDQKTWGQIFEELAPYYLLIGMSADEYWNGYPRLAREYREAHKKQLEEWNYKAWIQGRYIADAISATIGNAFIPKERKPMQYPKEPYALTEEEQIARKIRDAEEAEKRFFEKFSLMGGGSNG